MDTFVAALEVGPNGQVVGIVTQVKLPNGITCDAALWVACIGGAMQMETVSPHR